MMRAVINFLLVWGLLMPGGQDNFGAAGEYTCELKEPWVSEEMAVLILNQLSDPIEILSEAKSTSPSVMVQLLLWGYVHDVEGLAPAITNVDPSDLMAREDDYITGLIWLIANSPKHRDLLKIGNDQIHSLNAWANRFVKKNARKMFLYLMALSRITGEETLSRIEIEAIDLSVPDPWISFHIAGKLIQEGQNNAAHRKLIQAFESGSIRALYSLGSLEKSNFNACAQRGAFYIALFADLWSS